MDAGVSMNTLSRREEETLVKTAKARALRECDSVVKRVFFPLLSAELSSCAWLLWYRIIIPRSHFDALENSPGLLAMEHTHRRRQMGGHVQNLRSARMGGRSLLRGHVKTSTKPYKTACYHCECPHAQSYGKRCAPSPRDEDSLMPSLVDAVQDRNRWPQCGKSTSDCATSGTLQPSRSHEHTSPCVQVYHTT